MNPEPRNHHLSDDLDWLAFCYINDELTGQELETFEARLNQDQLARDAVESAVQHQLLLVAAFDLSEAGSDFVSAVTPSQATIEVRHWAPQRESSTSWYTVVGWCSAAAAILLVGLGLWLQMGRGDSHAESSQLARQTHRESADVQGDDWLGDQDYADQLADAMVMLGPEADAGAIGDTSEPEVPVTLRDDWMLDVFVEFGDELDDILQGTDGENKPSDSEKSWG